jgi:hypothetical protein
MYAPEESDRAILSMNRTNKEERSSLGGRFRKPNRSRAIPKSISGTPGQVRTGTTSGENPTDRVWAVRRPRSGAAWRRKPETFTPRSNGAFIVWRKTAKKRMVAKLHAIKAELRRRVHEPVADVRAWLQKVVNGYYRYHTVPRNIDRLSVFGQRLRRLWRLILRRRSQRGRSWNRITRSFKRWIPAPGVLHPYPRDRFLATHPGWEPYE